jgi:hypothetical protein
MSARISTLILASFLSAPAFAGTTAPPAPAPATTAPSTAAVQHTMGTVTKIDTTAKTLAITGTDTKPYTFTLGTLTLDKAIVVGSKVDVSHAANSTVATAVTVSK